MEKVTPPLSLILKKILNDFLFSPKVEHHLINGFLKFINSWEIIRMYLLTRSEQWKQKEPGRIKEQS